jgi:hypothetical protein
MWRVVVETGITFLIQTPFPGSNSAVSINVCPENISGLSIYKQDQVRFF